MSGAHKPHSDLPIFDPHGRFAAVAAHVLGIEGGYVDDIADHGGATNYGISLRFLKVEGALDADHDGFKDYDLDFDDDIDGADVRKLSRADALNLYYTCFWRRLQLDRLPLHIDAAVFDQAVNGGAVAAVKLLQVSVNVLALTDPLTVDGDLGRHTVAAVATVQRMMMANALLSRYRMAAEARYNAIVRADPSQRKYLSGWVKRARSLGDV